MNRLTKTLSDLKDNNKLLAFVNDLFGIHLIPTLIVNASLYPIYVALSSDYLNNLVYVGFILIILAVVVQYIADSQMRDFRKDQNNLEGNSVTTWSHQKSRIWSCSDFGSCHTLVTHMNCV